MTVLGAIIAGGQATRFGADKGAALLRGRPLIDHVADALHTQSDALVICGRTWPGLATVDDLPTPGLGPLGGLCGALHYARNHGYDAVLTAGCDVLPIPESLAAQLGSGPACVAGQRLLGVWPSTLAPLVLQHLETSADRSIRSWVNICQAREISIETPLYNVNRAADLDLLSRTLR